MPPKSNRRKSKNPKQQWRVKQPTRNWLELPSDLMLNILQRVCAHDILENAQKVCTAWHEICKDPVMWRVVYIDPMLIRNNICSYHPHLSKLSVDRSQGQLVDLTLVNECNAKLLQYVADRSSQLRRLELVFLHDKFASEAFKKLSLLEELSLETIHILEEDIEAIGCYCSLLKTLKVNQKGIYTEKEIAFAIGKNLPHTNQTIYNEVAGAAVASLQQF
ncbi:putative F-box/LRR-repeat protein 9 [Bidens hawaiensis]|uniref:putative F-box/LRR-repeat protein 9 n=1 Tax=Bidens hawaiensis TaxID=980011 RepID=UPI00404AB539